MRDARIVDKHVEAAELGADARGRAVDRDLIGDVEPNGVRVPVDAVDGLRFGAGA